MQATTLVFWLARANVKDMRETFSGERGKRWNEMADSEIPYIESAYDVLTDILHGQPSADVHAREALKPLPGL